MLRATQAWETCGGVLGPGSSHKELWTLILWTTYNFALLPPPCFLCTVGTSQSPYLSLLDHYPAL